MRTLSRLLLTALFALSAASPVHAEIRVVGCEYQRSGQFVMLSEGAPGMPRAGFDVLAAVDSYLRETYGDDGHEHVLAFYDDYDDLHDVLGTMGRPVWADMSGLTLRRMDWSWERCQADYHADDEVDLVLAKSGFRDATEFGLIIHELSHASGTDDGDMTLTDSASWWEWIGASAYQDHCNTLPASAHAHCQSIDALLS